MNFPLISTSSLDSSDSWDFSSTQVVFNRFSSGNFTYQCKQESKRANWTNWTNWTNLNKLNCTALHWTAQMNEWLLINVWSCCRIMLKPWETSKPTKLTNWVQFDDQTSSDNILTALSLLKPYIWNFCCKTWVWMRFKMFLSNKKWLTIDFR